MSDITSVYGKDFFLSSKIESAKYSAKLLANNIANKQYVFRYNSESMWQGKNMMKECIEFILNSVKTINP